MLLNNTWPTYDFQLMLWVSTSHDDAIQSLDMTAIDRSLLSIYGIPVETDKNKKYRKS